MNHRMVARAAVVSVLAIATVAALVRQGSAQTAAPSCFSTKYQEKASVLGADKSGGPRQFEDRTGWYQSFTNGVILYSSATSCHALDGKISQKAMTEGPGRIGYPSMDADRTGGKDGWWVAFTKGSI